MQFLEESLLSCATLHTRQLMGTLQVTGSTEAQVRAGQASKPSLSPRTFFSCWLAEGTQKNNWKTRSHGLNLHQSADKVQNAAGILAGRELLPIPFTKEWSSKMHHWVKKHIHRS